jgi:hypothetical protein
MVSEVRCQDSDCPHVETVIAILEGPGQSRRFNVMKPVKVIVEVDIHTLETKG